MSVRLILSVVLVTSVLVLVECSAERASASSSAIAKSQGSSSISLSSSSATARSQSSSKKKCRRVRRCPLNEEFSYCPPSIQRPQYCSEKGQSYRVLPSSTVPCKEGCVCKEKYLRAENGTCVAEEQCPITCGPNESLDTCPVDCETDYCPTTDEEPEPCVATDVCAAPACKCRFNYRRALNGSCIPTTSCPPFDCSARPNEEYNPCPPLCPTDDCSQASPSGECPPLFGNIGIVLPCSPTCRCIKGYWRLDGVCVPYGQCPGVCTENEKFSDCIQRECRILNCSQKHQSVSCLEIDQDSCVLGCVCDIGYLRTENGTCVRADDCEIKTCPANEELVSCIQGVCRPMDCLQKGEDVPCPDYPTEYCESGCICKEFFLRSENGTCIPQEECNPDSCPPNEQFTECIQAVCRPQDCKSKNWPVACPGIVAGSCVKGCVCKDNHYRNESGACIPEDQCTPNPCPPDEEYSNCTQALCREQNCTQTLPVACMGVAGEDCTAGCVCLPGYLRNDDGNCVAPDQCTVRFTCGFNEEFSECAQGTCRKQYCEQKGQTILCPLIPEDECEKGCVCQANYLRNHSGECIPEDQCPTNNTCGENEVALVCPPTCTSDNCPKSADEEEVCYQGYPCYQECKCKFNFRRADSGICIPTRSCPPFDCSDRINEEYNPCPPLCPNDECTLPRVKGRCPFKIGIVLECNPKCQCKDGYGRVNGTCLPFSECPGLCPTNEEYSPCKQASCQPEYCSDRDKDIPCAAVDQDMCERGCVCKENHFRKEYGDCVPYEECGGSSCPTNEEFSSCKQASCQAEKCSDRDKNIHCPEVQEKNCEKGCVCKENYFRNDDGDCVSYDECGGELCKNRYLSHL